MVSIRWIEKRKDYWERLEQLIRLTGSGVGKLNHEQLQELGLLYRQTASDLSVLLQDVSNPQLAAYLNQLLARGHNLIYMGQRPQAGNLISFYGRTYPRVFRETLPLTMLVIAIFLVAALAGWAVTLHDPGFAHRLLGPQMMQDIDRRQMWTQSVVAIKPVAASAITTNNLTVAFTVFALGVTAIGTIWMIILNGLLLGVVGAATWRAGMAVALWSFVVPHGVLELPAIFLAGAAGLDIARGLLFPGMLPRPEALARAGGRASRLVLGTLPLLLIAGTIEGFFSPTDAPVAMKFTLGAVLFAALLTYLFGAGRGRLGAGRGRLGAGRSIEAKANPGL
jgi:uncharacterized membrane protein SpoIIM required for sporulation